MRRPRRGVPAPGPGRQHPEDVTTDPPTRDPGRRPTGPATTDQTHPCLRCGAPIPLHEALCSACNPADLPQPAASQAHGTVFLGIALAVVAMLVIGLNLVGGVGPFTGRVAAAAPAGSGLLLTLQVRNDGQRGGQATCRVYDPKDLGSPPAETYVRTPAVPAGQSLTIQQQVAALGASVRPFAVDCYR